MINFDELVTPKKTGQRKRKTSSLPAKVPFDLEAAKAQFVEYRKAISEIFDQAQAHEVVDTETSQAAVAMAGKARKLEKRIEDQRKAIVEEPNVFIKSVNGFAKEFVKPLVSIQNILKTKLGEYQYKIELARREAERIAREEAEKLQARLDAEAKDKGVAPVTVTAPVIPKADTVTRAETGAAAHIRTQWVGEVENPDQVPRQLCSPDQHKINDAVRAGLREIPGVKIYEKAITVLRV